MAQSVDIQPLPLLRATHTGEEQCVVVTLPIPQLPPDVPCSMRVERGSCTTTIDLRPFPPGGEAIRVFLPHPSEDVKTVFVVTCGGERWVRSIVMGPVRRWTVHLVLHSHTDLGFTDPVSDVARIHNENTDRAVVFCRETELWPEGNRFKWTCEVAWQVQNYLRDRGTVAIAEFFRRVREGSIAVGALYCGELTGILGHEEAARSFAYAAFLRREHGIICDTALLCDVPGCTQGFLQIMAKSGIRNFIVADNNFIAPFLPRTDLPRPFFWEGPGASSVLCWYTDHPFYAYVEGEYYGVHESADAVERMLPAKLDALEKSGYPFDRFQIQYAFDNARITFRPAEVVRDWNARWTSPRLVLSTGREFLERMRRDHGKSIARRNGEWSDWWAGIVTGFPREEALTRLCHERAPAVESFTTHAALRTPGYLYPAKRINAAYDALLAFDEHSGGGALWAPKSVELQERALHEGYGGLHSAAAALDDLGRDAATALARLVKREGEEETLVVFNGSPFTLSGTVGFPGSTVTLAVTDVPPYGYRSLPVTDARRMTTEIAWHAVERGESALLENSHFRLEIDGVSGAVRILRDKVCGMNLLSAGGAFNLPVVYRPLLLREVELGKYIPEIYDGRPHPGEFLHWPAESVATIERTYEGDRCRVVHRIGGTIWLIQEYVLDPVAEGVRMTTIIPRQVRDDLPVRNHLESFFAGDSHLYVRFDFDLPGGVFEYDATGMVLRPAEVQFKGACRDYFPVQKWCRIEGADRSAILALPDTPLVDVGSVGLFRFKEVLDADPSSLFVRGASFREWGGKDESPYTRGEDLVLRFAVRGVGPATTGGRRDRASARILAAQFAASSFPLFLSAFLPASTSGILPSGSHSFCSLDREGVEVMALKIAETGRGAVLRLRETTGESCRCVVDFPGMRIDSARKAQITEEPLEALPLVGGRLEVDLDPWSIETILLELVPSGEMP